MRSHGRATSGAARGSFSERGSFLDRLDLEVGVLPARRIPERRLGRKRGLSLVLPHDVPLFERMRRGRHLRGIGPFEGVDRRQDMAELIPVADDFFWRDSQSRQAGYVLDLTGGKLGLGFGQDL